MAKFLLKIMSENLSYLSGRPGKGTDLNLFEQLVQSADASGGTPEDPKLKALAKEFLMGDAVTCGTASFYDFLKKENQGKKAYVCSGSACMMAGTQEGVKKALAGSMSEDEIGHMCCLGRCHENAAFNYDGKNYSAKSAEDIKKIVEQGEGESGDDYLIAKHYEPKLLTADFPGISDYYSAFKKVLDMTPDQALSEIKTSKLRGRGGAGFPMGFKLESCKNTPSDEKYIVCNADEGDPGAFSDRYLLEKQPHSVLFGMMTSAYVVGASVGVLYIRAEYPDSVRIVEDCIADLQKEGWLGKQIQGSNFDFKFKVIKAAGAYICGEETALLSSIEGQRPEVRVRPPYPTQEGLFNKPTVVNNVETFASLHRIISESGESFAKIGTERSTGTKLVSLDSFFNKPGLYEVEMGVPLSTIINDWAGGFREPVKGLHIGGPLGGIVPVSKIDSLTLDYESFASNGFLLGHASIVCIPESFPILKYLEHLFEFTADESCGKCFPCRLGSTRGKEMLEKAGSEGYIIDPELFDDLLETLEIGSLCALGGGLPLGVKNAMQYFSDELKPYFANRN